MKNNLAAKTSITINAPRTKVWEALTDPELIRAYLFGANAESEWKKGSSITYSGEWEGKPYQDKGRIIEIIPQQLLHTLHLSPDAGGEDVPENYSNVIYAITEDNGQTIVSVSQDNLATEEQLGHRKQILERVLENMKMVLEDS